jgi:putative endonuclease
MREHHYFVYMMISSSRRALYTGVTNSLDRRVFQHKDDEIEGFSQQYRAHRMVWFEEYSKTGGDCSRKTAERMAARKEKLAGADDKSGVERSERGMG